MGKRKGRKEIQETPILADESGENREQEEVPGKGAGFFACYLLTSLCPRFKGHTYIGYTLNPRRRIRQHNGEIGCGAWRTKRKRPWEMVLCIYGFPTNIVALQFEWAWQHPVESLAVRNAAASFKSLSGLANKIKLAYTMLTLPAWQRLNLTVNLFSTKYQKHTCACPALPQQMRTQICSMDDLPCYNVNGEDDNEFEEEDVHDSPPRYNEENVHQEISSVGVEPSGRNSPESTPYRKDHNSPAKTLFSFTSYVYNSPPSYNEEYVHQEISSPGVEPSGRNITSSSYVDELSREFDNRSATALVANEDQVLMKSPGIRSRDVEIIDLFTPSPCYGAGGRNSPESTPYRKEDHNSPAKTLFSFTSSSYVDELSREIDEAVDNRSATTSVANEDQVLMKSPGIRSRDVEIIDLFTPSPCYADSGCKKKRRPTTLCPEIIDLTNSPMYV